jgi:hypothetical protein
VPSSHAILAAFLLAQVFDGFFTCAAVSLFGPAAEGNPLLVTWMGLVGPQVAVVGAKLMASFCGVILYWLRTDTVLLLLTLFYATFAVGPWLMFFGSL